MSQVPRSKRSITTELSRSFIAQIGREAQMSPEEAREAYIKLSDIGVHIGLYALYSEREQIEVAKIYEDIREANKSITQVAERLYEVPSPWHAYFFAQSILGKFSIKYLYRGQSSPKNPLPSLYRKGINREAEKNLVESFKEYAKYYGLSDEEKFSEHDILLMARHHGLATSHLDYSIDPAVALAFAGTGENVDGYSRIFLTSLNDVLRYTKLYYPPFFAQRLYVQRGVLLDIPENEFPILHSKQLEVRFPREPSFVVYRGGKEIPLFPDNPLDDFFEGVATLAISEPDFAETLVFKSAYVEKLNKLTQAYVNLRNKHNLENVLRVCSENALWMESAMMISRLWIGKYGPDIDIDEQIVKAFLRDNNYTFHNLLREAEASLKSLDTAWSIMLQTKINNKLLAIMRAAS